MHSQLKLNLHPSLAALCCLPPTFRGVRWQAGMSCTAAHHCTRFEPRHRTTLVPILPACPDIHGFLFTFVTRVAPCVKH